MNHGNNINCTFPMTWFEETKPYTTSIAAPLFPRGEDCTFLVIAVVSVFVIFSSQLKGGRFSSYSPPVRNLDGGWGWCWGVHQASFMMLIKKKVIMWCSLKLDHAVESRYLPVRHRGSV